MDEQTTPRRGTYRAAPPLGALAGELCELPQLSALLGRSASRLAASDPAHPLVLSALAREGDRRPLLVVVATTAEAERLCADTGTLLGPEKVMLFPAWETLPFERVSPAVETMGRRLDVLARLASEDLPAVIVAPLRAVIQKLATSPKEVTSVEIRTTERIDQEELIRSLVAVGYRREDLVEHRGEFAVRGSIVDVFTSTATSPVRIDLWGDEVERLTTFSVHDQRSVEDIESVRVLPCRELLVTDRVRGRAEQLIASAPWAREQWERLAAGELYDGMESWLPWLVDHELVLPDLMGADSQIVLIEPRRLADRTADLIAEEDELARALSKTWGSAGSPLPGVQETLQATHTDARLHVQMERLLAKCDAPVLHLTTAPEGPGTPTLEASGWERAVDDGTLLARRLGRILASGGRVVVCASGEGSARNMGERLSELGIDLRRPERPGDLLKPGGWVVVAPLERGVVVPGVNLALLTEFDVTGRRRAHRHSRPRRSAAQRYSDDLAIGDHVVHDQHGVARFGGLVTRAIGGVERDYLLLEYKGDDRLYVPTDQVESVRRYTSSDTPTLSRLSGGSWQKAKARARSAVQEIAQELIVLYQKRISTEGRSFEFDSPWQRELDESFQFMLTPDQQRAINDVAADLERSVPMDRLLCGDVGFGKTEVALRAAFAVVLQGAQVAVLVPTTLLAQQHLQTFSDRLAPYPVRVEMLSRFLTPAQARKVAADVSSGGVDIIIGTHRLLSEDVRFKNLGLLIIDEEQRFGVSHKERIKEMRHEVDVLTLTATPIPRTLEMSLTGIRDLSLLHTPPAERKPILTYVGEYDERAVAEAIRRELLREGQVFFVHNRVKDIDDVAADLRVLVPEARVAVAHGQMDEGSLERIVLEFWQGDYDVLVCTTIIESGIDMPTVNTLVVDRADLLGLGQLHQLRGRVGRAGQRAYAYLFHPSDRVLSEDAYERLRTISESTDLGSGFAIAMRDLELRGSGNLLGTSQAGHIAAVGYDLYCQMVTEAVAELRGETAVPPVELNIDLGVDAHIPVDYMGRSEMRMEAYRRLGDARTVEEVDDVMVEWIDRFGPVPVHAARLLEVARLRALALAHGITDISVAPRSSLAPGAGDVVVRPVALRASRAMRLARLIPKARYEEASATLRLPVAPGSSPVEVVTSAIVELLED